MSKKNRRQHKKDRNFDANFKLSKEITPDTLGQQKLWDFFEDPSFEHFILHGYAGTGKTFCSLYLAIEQVLRKDTPQNKIFIVRSAVPTRDVGFLPGSLDEKMEVYEMPYIPMFKQMFQRGDAYSTLKKRGNIEVISTSYVRGTTLDDAFVIIDEAQNMNFHELDSVITRVGMDTRIMLCGDTDQTDLQKKHDKSGLEKMMDILSEIKSVGHIEFDEKDIMRSGFVKAYIKAKKHHY